jgi:DNA polymerase-3 subunit gamma/tau
VTVPAAPAARQAMESADPSAGPYAHADDDWGPPRDEDAPPLDEEPPMDWNPSAPATAWSAPPAVSSTARNRAATPPRSAGSPTASAGTAAPAAPEVSDDLWARAVEQSPGVWTVGAETNIGRYSQSGAAPDSGHTPEPEPQHYEPAAAQIPEDAVGAATPAVPAPDVAEGWAASPQPVAATAAAGPVAAPVPVRAAQVPVRAAQVPASVPPSVPVSTGRQSLYQRLSNSPEAEAGRAKAPSRAAAGTTAQVQDIPSADDETIEESGVFGRAAVERILGGKLVEERALDGSPLPPRF